MRGGLTDVGAQAAHVLAMAGGEHDQRPVADRLQRMGVTVTRAADLTGALHALDRGKYSMCAVGVAADGSTQAWIRVIRARHPELPIVGIADPANPVATSEAMQAGLTDVLTWPFHEGDVWALLGDHGDRMAEHVGHQDAHRSDRLVAQSPAMRLVLDLVRDAANADGGVWVSGEAGSGRLTVARAVHAASARSQAPFIVMDFADAGAGKVEEWLCGAPPAAAAKASVRERLSASSALVRASGGTLVVRDLSAAPARVQARLARVLRDGEALLGESGDMTPIDVRVMVIADAPVDAAVDAGEIRRDLVDRLSATRIDVPAMRGRREDIPVLAVTMLQDLCHALAAPPLQFSRSALALLSALPWSGNGRELRSVIEALVGTIERRVIQVEDVLAHVQLDASRPPVDMTGTLREARRQFEREWVSAALMRHHGRVEDAAKTLGIQRTNLYRKIRQLNVARALIARRP